MNDPISQDLSQYRDQLAEIPPLRTPAERHIALLKWITNLSDFIGIEKPILVGCGAVELFTDAQTATGDVDLIAPNPIRLTNALLSLGFRKSPDTRFIYHQAYSILFEFPSDHLREGEETVNIDIDGTHCKIISPEDLIVDRLESFEASGAGAEIVYAYLVYHLHFEHLDIEKLIKNVTNADVGKSFAVIQKLHEAVISENVGVDEQGLRLSVVIRNWRTK